MDKTLPRPAGAGRRSRGGRGSTEEVVLDLLEDHDELTRQQLVEHSGLSRSAVAQVVGRLLDAGALHETLSAPAGRGRPAQLLRRADPTGVLLGVDLGHNHVSVAVATPAAAIVAERRVVADVDEAPLESIALTRDLAVELLGLQGLGLSDVGGVAAGIPGPISSDGVLQTPSLLGSGRITRPAAALEEALGHPVPVTTDTVLGAIGEHSRGVAAGVDHVIYVKASHGIGAAAIIHGEVYRGSGGLAGELGHTHVATGRVRCRCGNRGCLETMAGLAAVQAELPPLYAAGALLDGPAQDPVVDRIIADAGRAVGRALAPVCNVLNPALVVTGGVLGGLHAEAFGKGVREALDQHAQPVIASGVQVVGAALGIRAELVGAVVQARRNALPRAM